MIYRNSYWSKELRQGYPEKKIGTKRQNAFAVFSGLFSFVLYFTLQTLKESVVYDTFPEIMQASYFSTLYVYIHIAFFLNALYLMIYYDVLFLSEIKNNAWYLLIKMRYRPSTMIFLKLMALVAFILKNYAVGFAVTALLSVFLKFPFVLSYMPALFISGFLDLIAMLILSLTLSLFVRDPVNTRGLIAVCAVAVKMLETFTGYDVILKNRIAMQNIAVLFDAGQSIYFPVVAAITALCGWIYVLRAGYLAKYYSANETIFPRTVSAGQIHPATGRIVPTGIRMKAPWVKKAIHGAAGAVLVAVILINLFFNLFIIFINAVTPGKEVAIGGRIPLIFQSETMFPEIMKNDLAFFSRTDDASRLETGQIILFEQDNLLYVERIIQKNADTLVVDIDHYPPMAQPGAMRKTVPVPDVHGIYVGKNRWLGALILFANTIIGRIVFLIVPTFFLFYREQIITLFKKRGER